MGVENEGRREESEVRGNEQIVESGRAITSLRAEHGLHLVFKSRDRPVQQFAGYTGAGGF